MSGYPHPEIFFRSNVNNIETSSYWSTEEACGRVMHRWWIGCPDPPTEQLIESRTRPGRRGSMEPISANTTGACARMVGEWIAPPAANPEPSMRIAPHSAPQCMVSFDSDTFLL